MVVPWQNEAKMRPGLAHPRRVGSFDQIVNYVERDRKFLEKFLKQPKKAIRVEINGNLKNIGKGEIYLSLISS